MLTDEQMAEIEALVNAVPKEPWVIEGTYPQHVTNAEALVIAECFTGPQVPPSIARFIVAARTAVPALLAEVRASRADAKHWHDTYQSEVNARDEFFGELLKLLPGAEDEGMDAYDQIPRGIEKLRARLKAAEDVCTVYGWTGERHSTEREKATQELWSHWCQLVGLVFAGDRSRISDEEIARLAAQRDETRNRTLAKIRGEGQC